MRVFSKLFQWLALHGVTRHVTVALIGPNIQPSLRRKAHDEVLKLERRVEGLAAEGAEVQEATLRVSLRYWWGLFEELTMAPARAAAGAGAEETGETGATAAAPQAAAAAAASAANTEGGDSATDNCDNCDLLKDLDPGPSGLALGVLAHPDLAFCFNAG